MSIVLEAEAHILCDINLDKRKSIQLSDHSNTVMLYIEMNLILAVKNTQSLN